MLAACAGGSPEDGPVGQRLGWFSYLNGEDLRAGCAAQTPDRIRLVYNADYTRQVRTYEVRTELPAGGAVLEARVLAAADLARMDLSDPAGPWRARSGTVALDAGRRGELIRALAESGGFGPPPVGLRLPADAVFWLAAGCHQGRGFVTAWRSPSEAFQRLSFPRLLAALDPTGVGFPALEPSPLSPLSGHDAAPLRFTLEIGGDGLVGPTHLFGAMPESLARWGGPAGP